MGRSVQFNRSGRVVAVTIALLLGPGAIGTAAPSAVPSSATTTAALSTISVTAQVKGSRIRIRIKGHRLGKKARVTLTGYRGKAAGVKLTARVRRIGIVSDLKSGRYLVTAKRITRGNGVARAKKIEPERIRVNRSIGAKTVITYRITRPVPDLRAETITAGSDHSCALDTSGKAWCWGWNSHGQLGSGSNLGRDFSPVPVSVAGDRSLTTISAGNRHTCAVDIAGQAWCWGNDDSGQLGNGRKKTDDRFAPSAVVGAHSFATVSSGERYTCAIDSVGKAWCWGNEVFGELGNGREKTGPRYSPSAVSGDLRLATISAGGSHTCALTRSGRALCWGYGNAGQLGRGETKRNPRHSPVEVSGDRFFSAISAGGAHTCALGTGGKAWCWGFDSHGQIGNGKSDNPSPAPVVPVPSVGVPTAVAGGSKYETITGGMLHTCALDTTGSAYCWGWDKYGQLGNGRAAKKDKYSPVAVKGDGSFATISAGAGHTCSLDPSGKAFCWGSDMNGQIGDDDGSRSRKHKPVAVAGNHVFQTP